MKVYQVTLDNPDGLPEFGIYEVDLSTIGPANPAGKVKLLATITPSEEEPLVSLYRTDPNATPMECSMHDAMGLFFAAEAREHVPS